jgi:hypothetical protein
MDVPHGRGCLRLGVALLERRVRAGDIGVNAVGVRLFHCLLLALGTNQCPGLLFGRGGFSRHAATTTAGCLLGFDVRDPGTGSMQPIRRRGVNGTSCGSVSKVRRAP